MSTKMIVRWAAVILCVLVFCGCEKRNQTAVPQEPPAKTEAQYKAEAEKEITEQNMQQELDKLEQEVNTDVTAAP